MKYGGRYGGRWTILEKADYGEMQQKRSEGRFPNFHSILTLFLKTARMPTLGNIFFSIFRLVYFSSMFSSLKCSTPPLSPPKESQYSSFFSKGFMNLPNFQLLWIILIPDLYGLFFSGSSLPWFVIGIHRICDLIFSGKICKSLKKHKILLHVVALMVISATHTICWVITWLRSNTITRCITMRCSFLWVAFFNVYLEHCEWRIDCYISMKIQEPLCGILESNELMAIIVKWVAPEGIRRTGN